MLALSREMQQASGIGRRANSALLERLRPLYGAHYMNPDQPKPEPSKTVEQYHKDKLRAARTLLIESQIVIPAYRPAYAELNGIISKVESMISRPL